MGEIYIQNRGIPNKRGDFSHWIVIITFSKTDIQKRFWEIDLLKWYIISWPTQSPTENYSRIEMDCLKPYFSINIVPTS